MFVLGGRHETATSDQWRAMDDGKSLRGTDTDYKCRGALNGVTVNGQMAAQ